MFSQFSTFLKNLGTAFKNVPIYFSRRILQDLKQFPQGFDWKYDSYVPWKHLIEELNAHSKIACLFYFFIHPKLDVMFVSL